jgi:hypothetical protein
VIPSGSRFPGEAQLPRGRAVHPQRIFSGSVLPGLHGDTSPQGGPSRRFAPVLPEDCVLFPCPAAFLRALSRP